MSTKYVTDLLNKYLEVGGKEPWQIARTTALTAISLYYVSKGVAHIKDTGLKKSIVAVGMKVAKNIPMASGQIDKQTGETIKVMQQNLLNLIPEDWRGKHVHRHLPDTGIDQKEILEICAQWSKIEEKGWKGGQVSGTVYHGDTDFQEFLNSIFGMFSLSNPLHPDIFPFCRKMEAEVIRMSCNLFNGDEKTCGSTTSGGTDSILLACKTHRDWAKEKFGIKRPEMILCKTAHAAFEKAAHYFGIKMVHLEADPVTYTLRAKDVKENINKNTILVVGSAPSYPQGVVDPIQELSDIVVQHEHIGLHVDCCLGGFLLPFLEKIGIKTPLFDFRVPGVTSISADTHKYGFSPKGTSVVLYKNEELRSHQYFLTVEWTGGVYATPTMSGSRSGGVIAATWAALVAMGEDGYKKCATQIMGTATKIKNGIPKIKGLKVLGDPIMSVVAFASDDKDVNIFMVGEAMTNRGWNLNQLQNPTSIHICCTYLHRENGQKFLDDLTESVQEARERPDKFQEGSAAIYGMAELLPPGSGVLDKIASGYVDTLYIA